MPSQIEDRPFPEMIVFDRVPHIQSWMLAQSRNSHRWQGRRFIWTIRDLTGNLANYFQGFVSYICCIPQF